MPTNRKESEVILRYVTDNSQNQVLAANVAIRKAMQDMANAAKLSGKESEAAYRKLADEIDNLQGNLKSSANQFTAMGKDVPDSIKKAQKQLKALNDEVKATIPNVRDLDEEFSQVSKDVALAGDVESGLRTAGGALGAVGLGGAERAVGTVAELPALVEALPKLKASVTGLPSAIGAAASALGPVGIGLGAVAIVTGLAFNQLANDIKKSADAARAAVEQDKEFFDVLVNGSEETARAAIKELEAENAVFEARRQSLEQRRALAQAEEEAADAGNSLISATALFQDVADALTTDAGDVYKEELLNIADAQLENTKLIIRYSSALDENAFAAETADERLQRLNDTLNRAGQTAIKLAETRRQEILLASDLEQQSTEQLTARASAIETEIKATSAALAELQESGFQTEQVQQQIISYNDTLRQLEREQAFINDTALELAAARDAEAAAAEEQLKQEEEAAKLAEERANAEKAYIEEVRKSLEARAKLEQDYADELIKISQRAAEEAQKALDTLNEKLADLGQDLGRDLTEIQRDQQRKVLEAQIEAQRDQADNLRDHVRNLEDIRRKADEDELQLRQKRDFAGVVNARRTARIAIQDEQREYARREEDRLTELARDAADRQVAFAQERADRIRKFQQDIADARANYQKQRQEQLIANAQMIADARARYLQEVSDLQQSTTQRLNLRKQATDIELNMLSIIGNAAGNLLNQLANSFSSFATGGGSTSISNATTNNNAGGITINANGQSSGVVNSIIDVLGGLFS